LSSMEIILFRLALATSLSALPVFCFRSWSNEMAARVSTWILVITFGLLTIDLFLSVIAPEGAATLVPGLSFRFCGLGDEWVPIWPSS